MKSVKEINAEIEQLQAELIETNKFEHKDALVKVKRLCKEFGFTTGMLKGALAEGRKKNG